MSGLTRITKDLDTFLADASIEAIEVKLASILRQFDEFNTCRHEMGTLYEADDDYFADIEADMEYMEGLDKVIVYLKGTLKHKEPNFTAVTKNAGIRLPKITLPVLESDPTNWMGFWNMFHCSVHSNEKLSEIQKFTY